MNIIVLNWRDIKHPLAGGAEVAVFEHAYFWRKQGAHVSIIASHFPGASKTETINGIHVLRTGSVYTVHLYTMMLFLKGYFKDDDIIIDCFHFIPYFSVLFQKFTKAKIIAHSSEVAGTLWFSNLPKIPALMGYLLEPYFIKLYRNHSFITVSKSTKHDLVKLGHPPQSITVVHNGIRIEPVDKVIKKEKRETVLFLGRISLDKGIRDACEAINQVIEDLPLLQFWIVGKEEKEGMLNAVLDQYPRLRSRVTYFGFVSEKKKFEIYKKAWLLIHPSEKEGWGLTVIEAASQETPTVGYNVEGLRDSIVHGKTGILVPYHNTKKLARAVFKLITQSETRRIMSKRAEKWAQAFRWEESAKNSWEVLLKELHKK